MAFMQPEALDKQEWIELETNNGTSWIPFDVLSKSEAASARQGDFEPLVKYSEGARVYNDRSRIMKGYGVRLSAPGYMDATEWEVYGSKKEALKRARELGREAEGEDYATKKRTHATKKSPAQLDREIATIVGPFEGMQVVVTKTGAQRHGVRPGLTGTIKRVASPDVRHGKPSSSARVLVSVHGTEFSTDWPTDALKAVTVATSSWPDARDLLATRAQRNKRK